MSTPNPERLYQYGEPRYYFEKSKELNDDLDIDSEDTIEKEPFNIEKEIKIAEDTNNKLEKIGNGLLSFLDELNSLKNKDRNSNLSSK